MAILRDAFLKRSDFNVFIIDWGKLAITPNYIAARKSVNDVGHVVGQFIDFLNEKVHVPFSSVNVIGHSLGAHVAGISGKRVTRGKVESIVGLDPALPLFSITESETRIHHTDAVYVETIHTDMGRLGFDEPLGHASFFPNWGKKQPGCGIDLTGGCSHQRSVLLYSESIANPRGFYATKCHDFETIQKQKCTWVSSNVAMGGEPVFKNIHGLFYLTTNDASPFGQGWRE